jgi:hypothetical protein
MHPEHKAKGYGFRIKVPVRWFISTIERILSRELEPDAKDPSSDSDGPKNDELWGWESHSKTQACTQVLSSNQLSMKKWRMRDESYPDLVLPLACSHPPFLQDLISVSNIVTSLVGSSFITHHLFLIPDPLERSEQNWAKVCCQFRVVQRWVLCREGRAFR